MEILIKKATIEDLEDILNNRMDFLYQVIGKQPSDEFKKVTKDYLYDNLNGNLLCFVATLNKLIVSSVIVCIYNVIPKPSNITGKVGYVFNVYTISEFRGKGLATKLMRTMIDEAKRIGIGELYLSATDEGKGIYEKLQFQHLKEEMCLKLI
jgi:Acetyltransferases